MTREQATAALKFLQRVQLGAMEIPAFLAVTAALGEVANPPSEQALASEDRSPSTAGAS
jgi:hypothetical protein